MVNNRVPLALLVLSLSCAEKQATFTQGDPIRPDSSTEDSTLGGTIAGEPDIADGTVDQTDATDGQDGVESPDGQDGVDGAVDAPDGQDGVESPDGQDGTVDTTDGQDGTVDSTDGQDGAVDGSDGSLPDTTSPQVVSAFSADGKTVTVRFSEIVAGDGVTAGNFNIKGSDNSTIALSAATVDGRYVRLELSNPSAVDSSLTYTCFVTGIKDTAGNPLDTTKAKSVIRRTMYLSILWHQHQPLYYDSIKDQQSGPWVRKHATKDYYDMASILALYPDMHLNINFTSVLNFQLQMYIDRLLPYVDFENNTVDEEAFLAMWKGKTDPFVDLLLEDTPSPAQATEAQIGLFYDDPWATVSTADATMSRWPQYVALREKNPAQLTQSDFLHLKIFFELAWFDPDFIKGPVSLPTGRVVDLSDLVTQHADGTFTLKVPASEQMANRLVAENVKIIEAVIPIHKQLMYNYQTKTGQIEMTMTPYYHPILPLIQDTNLAKKGQPFDLLPEPNFSFAEDAEAQVLKAVAEYEAVFGIKPQGVWCGEGSVAEEIVKTLRDAGLRWTATDRQVLQNSTPSGQAHWFPYRVDADTAQGDGGSHDDEMLIVFRDTQMSNDIGFKYQSYTGKDAANEIIANVLAQAPPFGAKDRLVTLIVDGENAWEEYRKEHDGKGFFHALYGGLSESYQVGEIIPVTVSEYIDGNPARAVPPHPIAEQTELEPLWPGSWIDGTYSVWVGEGEENVAWGYLLKARTDLQNSGLPRPNPSAPPPSDIGSKAYLIWLAWESIYAAEGSDWFWWYGFDMTTPANDDTPFDKGFRGHLASMYQYMNAALTLEGKSTFPVPDFAPIIQAQPQPPSEPFPPGEEPDIDGSLLPNEAEWTNVGGFFYDNDSGAQANQNDDIALVYYGWSTDALYLGILSNDDLSKKLGTDYRFDIYLSHKKIVDIETGETQSDPKNTTSSNGTPLIFAAGGAAREVRVSLAGASAVATLRTANGSGGWTSGSAAGITVGGPISKGKLIEVKIPFANLNMAMGDPLEVAVTASSAGEDLDVAPSLDAKPVFDDPTNAVYVTFTADVSEKTGVKVDTYGPITTMPPPKSNGIVYITGNQDKLTQWTPNKLPMLDDGTGADAVANDGVWSITLPLTPAAVVRYKYTIGLPKNEGKWSGTEEFPLTERGFVVTKDPTKTKMLIKDVFADRPQPTGTMGKKTVVTESE